MKHLFARSLTALAVAALLLTATASAARHGSAAGAALLDPVTVTLQGTPNAQGGCKISTPKLKLAPTAPAIQADEVSVDPATCASQWQVGTPVSVEQPLGPDDSSASADAVGSTDSPSLASSSGYERAWTTDVVGITLTSDQSNVSWSWNGSCVTSSSGSAYWTWHSGTGWSAPYNKGSWISRTCNNAKVWSQATFKNSSFCWPLTVHSQYTGVSAQGKFNGWLYGWVSKMSYSGSCLPLHLHSQLVRVTG
jgi:hypothetical protein